MAEPTERGRCPRGHLVEMVRPQGTPAGWSQCPECGIYCRPEGGNVHVHRYQRDAMREGKPVSSGTSQIGSPPEVVFGD